LLVVFHHRLSQSFSEIGPIVVVLKRPDHGKNFAGVFGRELLWIGVEENCAPLRFRAASVPLPPKTDLARW
jgi:hypothetical protein